MKKPFIFSTAIFVLVLWGSVLCPLDVRAGPHSSAEPSIINEDPDWVVAQSDKGYVDMEEGETGDRFVDEDGDGLDDRHMRRHQKRNQQRWHEDDRRGSGSGNGAKGSSGGQQGHGYGPGRGGR
jgi:hypothetical protein